MANNSAAPSPADLDAMARTVVAEAGSDPTAQLAVASTIANRLAAGTYGSSPTAVVRAPHQFEVWSNGQAQGVDPSSPAYGIARQIAADALSGAAPDPTGGATHFFSPSAQASLGRSAPSWAGGGVRIGGNVFNAPNGPVMKKTAPQTSAAAAGPDVDGLIKLYGGQSPSAGPSQPAAAATPSSGSASGPGVDVDALMKLYGGAASPGADQPAAPASTDTAPPLTIHAHPGALAAAPGDGMLASIGKNVATGAIKGAGDAVGVVGNTGSLADYLMARTESAITGQPTDQILASLAQQRAQQQQNPTIIGRIANAIDPRHLLPSGSDVSAPVLARTGEYQPTSEAGRVLQAGVETAVGSLGPGVRGTGAVGPATAATVASQGTANALMQAATQAPGALVSGGASQYGTDATGSPLVGLAAGAVPALVAGAGGAAVNRLIGRVDPATAALADTARNTFGIPLGVGQISDSPAVRFASSVVNKLPLSGAGPELAAQRTAFNRAVSNQFGEDAPKITPDVMQAARTRLGAEFDRIGGATTITNTQALGGDLRAALSDAMTVLPDAELKPLAAQVQNIADVIRQNNGVIPGESYQALTKKGAPLDRAMSSADPNVAFYASRIRGALDDALEANAPPNEVEALRSARSQYKAMKTVEDLVEKSPTGDISPALLMGAVRKSYGTMAYNGGGDMGDLARIGQRFLKEPPSSGTAERLGVMNMLAQLGGGAASFMAGNPGPLAATAAAVPMSLLAGRGVRSFLGSDAATNRLIASSLGRQQAPGLGNRLLATGGLPAMLQAGGQDVPLRQQRR